MDIKKLAHTPELIRVEINDEEIIKTYGEPIIFYMYDHIDIMTYFDFYRSQSQNDSETFNKVMRKLLRGEDGELLLTDTEVLPVDVTLSILGRINENLGKSKTRSSTQKLGKQSK